jgi:hypothetical protein
LIAALIKPKHPKSRKPDFTAKYVSRERDTHVFDMPIYKQWVSPFPRFLERLCEHVDAHPHRVPERLLKMKVYFPLVFMDTRSHIIGKLEKYKTRSAIQFDHTF